MPPSGGAIRYSQMLSYMPAAMAGPRLRAGFMLPPVRPPKNMMPTDTVRPIATGARLPALPLTAAFITVLTRKNVPIISRKKAAATVMPASVFTAVTPIPFITLPFQTHSSAKPPQVAPRIWATMIVTPKARATVINSPIGCPLLPTGPATEAAPQPMKTSAKVPINSAISAFVSVFMLSVLLQVQ